MPPYIYINFTVFIHHIVDTPSADDNKTSEKAIAEPTDQTDPNDTGQKMESDPAEEPTDQTDPHDTGQKMESDPAEEPTRQTDPHDTGQQMESDPAEDRLKSTINPQTNSCAGSESPPGSGEASGNGMIQCS